ncbi:MAG TPA: chemotaxis protein CheW [Crenotrichaceae bacterium]|nr:chemotaxis protein CheW [Crenotrichaceae bacterium]
MMFLLITIGNERYGIDVSHVVKVIPPVAVKEIPCTPDYISGLLNFHGHPIPVIDINYLYVQQPVSIYLGSRIIVVDLMHSKKEEGTESILLGILAEGVTEAIHIDQKSLVNSGIDMTDRSFVNRVVMNDKEIIQLVNLANLVPDQWKSKILQANTLLADEVLDQ